LTRAGRQTGNIGFVDRSKPPPEGVKILLEVILAEDMSTLTDWIPAWDARAEAAGLPTSAPAWQLAWWKELAPPLSELRVVLVVEGEHLVGVAPFFLQRGRFDLLTHRLLGAGHSHHLALLAEPGREGDVARIAAETLASRDPVDIVGLEGIDADSPLVKVFGESTGMRRHAFLHVDSTLPASTIQLQGSFDEWLTRRPAKFRREILRRRRRFAEAAGRVRLIEDPAEVESALASLFALHSARWADRGDRTSVSVSVERAVRRAVDDLPIVDRFRIWMVEVGGTPVGANLFFVAGGTLLSYMSGFDPQFMRFSPVMLAKCAAIEDAFERRERLVDLGGGESESKRTLADVEVPVTWVTLFVRGRRYPLARAEAAPKHARTWLRTRLRRLPSPVQRPLRRARAALTAFRGRG
jgi:CelD/BcsL family acetyltransferase involved in cellulose biosynthesis